MMGIIGAGPIGSYLAGKLGAEGVKVEVYEEHKKIGCPVACTGILTSHLQDFFRVSDDYVVNKIKETNVFGPGGDFVNFKLKKNFIIDREKFDCYLADVAKSNGVIYNLGWKFLKLKGNDLVFNKCVRKSDVVVGADGPNSLVAKSAGMFGKRNFVVGHQARVKLKEKVDSDLVEFFLDENGFIGWVVPESEKIVRLGVAVKKNAKSYFDKLLRKRNGKILGWQSGVIPIYVPKIVSEKKGVYLVGDSAGQVKATTYGGILPGLSAADVLADVIVNEKREGSYEKGWRRKI